MALADEIRSVLSDTMNLPQEFLDGMLQYQAQNILPVGALRAPTLIPTGTSGATAAMRFVGGSASGPPTSGTYQVGDVVITQDGSVQICIVAGSPGSWTFAGRYGYELSYDPIITTVSITGTTSASPTTIITETPTTFEGSPVNCEFFAPIVTTPSVAAGNTSNIGLYESGTLIAQLFQNNTTAAATAASVGVGRLRFAPSAGVHTYTIGAWATSATGNPRVFAGTGTLGALAPAYLRFTKV